MTRRPLAALGASKLVHDLLRHLTGFRGRVAKPLVIFQDLPDEPWPVAWARGHRYRDHRDPVVGPARNRRSRYPGNSKRRFPVILNDRDDLHECRLFEEQTVG